VPSLNHIGITVSDIAQTAGFLSLLGFEPRDPDQVVAKDSWIRTMTGYAKADLRIAMVHLGDTAIELVSYVSPEGEPKATTELRDVGNTHIAVTVKDIDAEYRRLRDAGIEFISAPIRVPDGPLEGARGVYLTDPDGNLIELSQETRAD